MARVLHRFVAMVAKTFSATHFGITGKVIEIEAALQKSLPTIQITGLPGDVIKESRERVRACLVSLGFEIPSARLVVHLSPAHTPKQGSQFDLAIAVSILGAEGCLPALGEGLALLGEIALDGRIQRIPGALSLVQALEQEPRIRTLLVPRENGWEAGILGARKARLVANVGEVIDFLRGTRALPEAEPVLLGPEGEPPGPSLDAVIGQNLAKRALQIALAGRHHLLFLGPPGVGKSMIAGCAPTLLPPLEPRALVDVVRNHGPRAMGRLSRRRPFRSPHHSISSAAFLGGGSGVVIPGEVTLAHHGVLFLDEFPEYRRDVIEGLREPLQNGEIHLHRIGQSLSLPARFTLIAAMNPCPCGYSLDPSSRCHCSIDKIRAYRKRISGPILDRMDLCVVLSSPRAARVEGSGLSHQGMAQGIARAYRLQRERYGSESAEGQNGDRAIVLTEARFALEGREKIWLEQMIEGGKWSFRAVAKTLKVARTIADLADSEPIKLSHLQEAWALRCPEPFTQGFAV